MPLLRGITASKISNGPFALRAMENTIVVSLYIFNFIH